MIAGGSWSPGKPPRRPLGPVSSGAMRAYALWIADVRVAWVVVVVVLVLTALSVPASFRVRQDDDLLAFLPPNNPDIATFRAINEDFGGVDVALVGIQAPPGGDVFSADFLERLRATTRAVREVGGISGALSLANVDDFSPDPAGGIRVAPLVESLPADDAARLALRAHVLSRDHVVGSLVAPEGDAVLLLAFLGADADPRAAAKAVQDVMSQGFADSGAQLHFGGSPFISSYVFDSTQRDLARLTPLAVAAILLVLVLTLKDAVATALGLVATGMGIAWSRALMAVLDVPFNLVLAGMPIILFAVGSAYSIHVLARYTVYRRAHDRAEAVVTTVVHTGPLVIAAGLTTVAGLLSFLAMDIEPLRVFGLFTALGVLFALLLSLTFVPAVLRLVDLRSRGAGSPFKRPLARAGLAVLRARHPVAVGVLAFAAVAAFFVSRVDTRVDQASFFHPDSPPALADAFLARSFGGSTFLQVRAAGDLTSPEVLREVQWMADRLRLLPHVTQVQAISGVLALVNEAMEGQARVPDTRAKVGTLFGLVQGNPALGQLVRDDRSQALLTVKIGSSDLDAVAATLAAVEAVVAVRPDRAAAARTADRVRASLRDLGVEPPTADTVLRALGEAPTVPPELAVPALSQWLQGAESLVPLSATAAEEVARALVALPAEADPAPAIAAALALPLDDGSVQDLAVTVGTPLSEARSAAALGAWADAVVARLGVDASPEVLTRLRPRVGAALADLAAPAQPVSVAWTVSGLPVMHRGLSTSVTGNQLRSLALAMGLVVVVLALFFRSLTAGVLAAAPTALTLVVVYGLMGLQGVRLDIGTSMIASLVIGAGVDYAVHMLGGWYAGDGEGLERALARATARTGPAIWTNALMVGAGFFVLTLGEARPLQNVGMLTCLAMLTAAAATFLVIPLVARRPRYTPLAEAWDPADDDIPELTT